MSQLLASIKLLVQLLPILIEAIKVIEEAIPGTGAGEQKLSVVRSIFESVYETLPDIEVPLDTLWRTVQSLTSRLVFVFNSTGVFK